MGERMAFIIWKYTNLPTPPFGPGIDIAFDPSDL